MLPSDVMTNSRFTALETARTRKDAPNTAQVVLAGAALMNGAWSEVLLANGNYAPGIGAGLTALALFVGACAVSPRTQQ